MIYHARGWTSHCWVRGLIRLSPDLTDDELAMLLKKRIDRRLAGITEPKTEYTELTGSIELPEGRTRIAQGA